MDQKLRGYLEGAKIDAYFIAKKPNVRYISQYMGDDSYVFITQNKKYIITDPRYTEQATIEAPDYEVINWRKPNKTVGDAVAHLIELNQVKTLGFEDDELSYQRYSDIERKSNVTLVPAAGVIEKMREIKTPEELHFLRAACDISCRAFNRILEEIRVGITEKELAAMLSTFMVLEGADTQPYGNILVSGAKTSLLHGIPSNKAIEYGDFVLMDFGCQFNGYLSDMTRTVVMGKATDKQKEVYRLEKEMLEVSLEHIKAGVRGKDVYRASLGPIKETDYLQYHYANVGHGIGMFVHENPMMSEQYEGSFEAGNVVTIEPGLYIPGWGGVRIEDQVIVTETGNENLISITHELIEI